MNWRTGVGVLLPSLCLSSFLANMLLSIHRIREPIDLPVQTMYHIGPKPAGHASDFNTNGNVIIHSKAKHTFTKPELESLIDTSLDLDILPLGLEVSDKDLIDKYRRNVVTFAGFNSFGVLQTFGSGLMLDSTGHILSARHCVDDYQRSGRAYFAIQQLKNGSFVSRPLTILAYSKNSDVSLTRISPVESVSPLLLRTNAMGEHFEGWTLLHDYVFSEPTSIRIMNLSSHAFEYITNEGVTVSGDRFISKYALPKFRSVYCEPVRDLHQVVIPALTSHNLKVNIKIILQSTDAEDGFTAQAMSQHGNSGSGLFDKQGRYCGPLSWGYFPLPLPSQYSGFVTPESVYSFLSEYVEATK